MKSMNITHAMKKNYILVNRVFILTVYAGQYHYVISKIGMKSKDIIFNGAGANISIPNLGSHFILK